jgi:hypothetical protein
MELQLALAGMARERQRLSSALRNRESLLVLGAGGSGKSRLLTECLGGEVLYVPWGATLHVLLVAMARALLAYRHGWLMQHAKPAADTEAWLAAQPSIHLKGLLWNAVESSPVPMALDGISGAGFASYRFLQRIYHAPGMVLFAAARDLPSLGALGRLFWNPERILNMAPLSEREAGQLFETAASHFQLRNLDLSDFREKVLESARGNPGQIIEMCRLASQPQYLSGRSIKFSLLRIDTVMKFGQ